MSINHRSSETRCPPIDWETIRHYDTIDNFVERAMLAEAAREEEYLQRHAPIFFAQGYRIGELRLHRRRMLGTYPDRDLICLMPARHVWPLTLALRIRWRRYFPYKPTPKAKANA